MIPRPETEELVNWIIQDSVGKEFSILDIGTGSGCIALALSKNLPLATVTGVDISEEALETARKNAALNHADIRFFRFDLLKRSPELADRFEIIVSNPPYVRESEKKFMQSNVLDYEPPQALFVPDEDPLMFYKAIADLGNTILTENGCVYCEINEALPEETAGVFQGSNYRKTEIRKDINNRPRMIKAVKKR
jgi:release factor glutamine methyltransferase